MYHTRCSKAVWAPCLLTWIWLPTLWVTVVMSTSNYPSARNWIKATVLMKAEWCWGPQSPHTARSLWLLSTLERESIFFPIGCFVLRPAQLPENWAGCHLCLMRRTATFTVQFPQSSFNTGDDTAGLSFQEQLVVLAFWRGDRHLLVVSKTNIVWP